MTETPETDVLDLPYIGENVAQDSTEDLGPEFEDLAEGDDE